jgi:hypothetical protein
MEDLLKELLQHYNEMVIAMAEKVQDAQDNEDRAYKEKYEYKTKYEETKQKNAEQAKKIEDLSRTISILQRTLKCHNDFLDNGELREDYEKFQDKWLSEQEEQKNG